MLTAAQSVVFSENASTNPCDDHRYKQAANADRLWGVKHKCGQIIDGFAEMTVVSDCEWLSQRVQGGPCLAFRKGSTLAETLM